MATAKSRTSRPSSKPGCCLLTCVWIVYEATKRLFFHSVEIEPSVWAFVVMGISIVVDFWRSRRLKRIADKYDSQALLADALHFSTDIWSSAVVILGLVLVLAGRTVPVPWLAKADPIAALVVACIVVYVSWRLARQTIDALLDGAPAGVRSQIIDAVSRSRRSAGDRPRSHSSRRQQVFRRCLHRHVAECDLPEVGAGGQRSGISGSRTCCRMPMSW